MYVRIHTYIHIYTFRLWGGEVNDNEISVTYSLFVYLFVGFLCTLKILLSNEVRSLSWLELFMWFVPFFWALFLYALPFFHFHWMKVWYFPQKRKVSLCQQNKYDTIDNKEKSTWVLWFMFAGWPSTIGLVWHCSIPCITCSPCRISVRIDGNHEASPGENTSQVCLLFNWPFQASWWILNLICFIQTDDPAQKNTLLIFKFLPLMIGYFSLSVPSGLSIYWLVDGSNFSKLFPYIFLCCDLIDIHLLRHHKWPVLWIQFLLHVLFLEKWFLLAKK